MRIGILTYHQSVNNGAVMQAYSLSSAIKKRFPSCDVEIIDYQMKKVNNDYSFSLASYFSNSTPKKFVKKCLNLIKNPQYLRNKRRRTAVFKGCLNKLPLSPKCIIDDDDSELVQYINDRYDMLVVGSDAIWNYITRGFPNAYLPSQRVKCKKLSYAASCYGMNFLDRPDNEKEYIKEALNDFSYIGVRDTATEDFVKWSESSVSPIHNCDPTAFLDVDNLPIDITALQDKLKKKGFDFDRPTIGMMGTDKMLNMIRKLYGKEYQIAALYEFVDGADVNLYDLEPYEWAYVFRYFKVTYTTYFHGTLLSLRNGTPVVCIALDTEFAKYHTPKTLDVLTRLGFEDWYFKTDYKEVNIASIKQKSDELLASDYKDIILNAMDEEAKTSESFFAAIQEMTK